MVQDYRGVGRTGKCNDKRGRWEGGGGGRGSVSFTSLKDGVAGMIEDFKARVNISDRC